LFGSELAVKLDHGRMVIGAPQEPEQRHPLARCTQALLRQLTS
jgi:hypothetical protein